MYFVRERALLTSDTHQYIYMYIYAYTLIVYICIGPIDNQHKTREMVFFSNGLFRYTIIELQMVVTNESETTLE